MNPIRSITEGAILTALYSIFLIAFLILPVIGILIMFLFPFPFIIYVIRHSVNKGLVFLAVTLIITYLFGSIAVIPITFMFGTTGIIMGYIYSSQRKNAFEILISGSLSFLANFVLFFIAMNVFFKVNFIEETKKIMYQSIGTAEKIVSGLGQPVDQFKLMYDSIELISYIAPSVMVVTSIFFAIATQFISSFLLKRLRYDIKPFPPLRQWHFPKSILWYYLIVTIVYMLGLEQGTTLFIVFINLFIVLEFIMTVQGFSFMFFYFYTSRKSLTIPIIILVVFLLLPFLLSLIRILGIIDLGFDLRRRMKNPQ